MFLPTFIDFILSLKSISKAVFFSFDLRRSSNTAILSKSKLFWDLSYTRKFFRQLVARRETWDLRLETWDLLPYVNFNLSRGDGQNSVEDWLYNNINCKKLEGLNLIGRWCWTLRHKLQEWCYTARRLKNLSKRCVAQSRTDRFVLLATIAVTKVLGGMSVPGYVHWAIFRAICIATNLQNKLQERLPN